MRRLLLASVVTVLLLDPSYAFSQSSARQSRVEEPSSDETFSCWLPSVDLGVTSWLFNKEKKSHFGPAGYLNLRSTEYNLNYRVGIEGGHINLRQKKSADWAEWEGKYSRITLLRIPFALEYVVPLEDSNSHLFIGGGPDLLHTANDHTETTVGGHLSTRFLYNFTPRIGLAVEAGYMWARFDSNPPNVNLDGAYITPTVNFAF